jgi:hypothetical protein
MKPFKGPIFCWEKLYFDNSLIPESLGYHIFGYRHPLLKKLGIARLTSAVVFHDEPTNRVETLNSWYQLVD